MTDTNEDYKTLALKQAISWANDINMSQYPVEQKVAARTRIVNLLFYAILNDDNITGERIKKIIEESK